VAIDEMLLVMIQTANYVVVGLSISAG